MFQRTIIGNHALLRTVILRYKPLDIAAIVASNPFRSMRHVTDFKQAIMHRENVVEYAKNYNEYIAGVREVCCEMDQVSNYNLLTLGLYMSCSSDIKLVAQGPSMGAEIMAQGLKFYRAEINHINWRSHGEFKCAVIRDLDTLHANLRDVSNCGAVCAKK